MSFRKFIFTIISCSLFINYFSCTNNDKISNHSGVPTKITTIEKNLHTDSDITNDQKLMSSLIIEGDKLKLIKEDNDEIFKIPLNSINPYFKHLNLKNNNFNESPGLFHFDNDLLWENINLFFTKETIAKIPKKYSCNYANIGPPAIASNSYKSVASFIFEWGNALLNENSIGEFQCSTIFIWDNEGISIDTLKFDFGATPYLSKNGNFIFLEYAKHNYNSRTKDIDMSPSISIYDIAKRKIIFNTDFTNMDLNVGGYNNGTNYFGFTVIEGKNEFQIFYFDDQKCELFKRKFNGFESKEGISIIKDFSKVPMN